MESPESRYLALYWGRRGGSEPLFDQIIEMCNSSQISVLKSRRPTIRLANGSSAPISLFYFTKWFTARRSLVKKAVDANVKTVLIVMASPWDLFLGKHLIEHGIEVVRIIHDATPHPGEVFPPKFWIRWLICDSSRIITFSQFVADQLILNYGTNFKRIRVSAFPIPKAGMNLKGNVHESNKILLIGRGKKYQGQKLLEDAWKLVKISEAELIIAGEGFNQSEPISGITYKNKWMSHQEFENEIASSRLVIFPYLEASQSGTIPICNALGVPVIVTPVGGLVEQVSQGKNGVIAKEVSAMALAEAIEAAWVFDWKTNYLSTEFSVEKFIQDCFLLN